MSTIKVKLRLLAILICGLALGIAPVTRVNAAEDIDLENFNKLSALNAAIDSVKDQVPQFEAYWDMYWSAAEVTGQFCRWDVATVRRTGWEGGCFQTVRLQLELGIATLKSELVNKPAPGIELGPGNVPESYKSQSFLELITTAKTLPEYSQSGEFTALVNGCAYYYDTAVASLRKNLALVSPSATNLETQDGVQLLAFYQALPNLAAYENLDEAYNDALVSKTIADFKGEDYLTEEQYINDYKALVAAATAVYPEFKVNLSEAKQFETSSVSTAPTAPNTGDNAENDFSAAVIKVAVMGIAGVAIVSGAIFIAKRHFFSPLKRRK